MDKPKQSKLILKLITQTKLDERRIMEMEREVLQTRLDKRSAIDAAVNTTIADYEAKLASVRKIGVDYVQEINDKHAALWDEANEERNKLLNQLKLAREAGRELLYKALASDAGEHPCYPSHRTGGYQPTG